jgi:hypothetical protein
MPYPLQRNQINTREPSSKIQLIRKIKSYLLTKLFIDWVNDEFDLELIQTTQSMLDERETFLKTLQDFVKGRVEVKGFGNFDNSN